MVYFFRFVIYRLSITVISSLFWGFAKKATHSFLSTSMFLMEVFPVTCAGGKVPGNRLEFRHRLAISIGAAKGLAHLHSLSPRLIHKDFKTANVLVDENFIAKVADAGVRNFLGREDVGTSSHIVADQIFLSPEVQEFKRFSEKSDVYAFGVFLLELVSGREASEPSPSSSTQTLVDWMQNLTDYADIPMMIDERLGGTYTAEGVEELITLTLRCVDVSSEKRPTMSFVVTELERILDKEVSLTTVMGEGTPTVTLGSQLFKATK